MSTATAQLYETDFYGWVQQQASALRAGSFVSLDLDNLVEEVESMGRSERNELESRLELLLVHLLKWQYQPNYRGRSWQLTIKEQRRRVAKRLKDSPSLRALLPETYSETYSFAAMRAAKETGLPESAFPPDCPWAFDQAMNADFWPDAEG